MGEVTALFWDLGGVVLTNGWDESARDEAARRFCLDREDFEQRHKAAFPDFECGRMTLDTYLERTIFFCPRSFGREEFREFVFGRSDENTAARMVLDELTATGRYLLAALNNEGSELNAYRIRTFHLARNFTVFLSSCYLGVRKPDEAHYLRALAITQREPGESLFIDDRLPNVDAARQLGMRAIHFQNPAQLRAELEVHGIRSAGAEGERRSWNSA